MDLTSMDLPVLVEQCHEEKMQGDVAIHCGACRKGSAAMAVTDAGDGVGLEFAQLADAHPGAGQQLDRNSSAEMGARLPRPA